MNSFAIKLGKDFLDVILTLSLGERNRIPRGRSDREKHSLQRKQCEQRYKLVETHVILRLSYVARRIYCVR